MELYRSVKLLEHLGKENKMSGYAVCFSIIIDFLLIRKILDFKCQICCQKKCCQFSMLKCSYRAKSILVLEAFFFVLVENIIYDRNQNTYLTEYFFNSVHVDFYSFAGLHCRNCLY